MIPTGLPGASSGLNFAWANQGAALRPDSSSPTGSSFDIVDFVNDKRNTLMSLLQQNPTSGSALDQVKELAKNDDDWARFYYETLLNRENQQEMIKWYEDFNNSYYQRSVKDLEKAGLSPWLALQKLGMSGTGSVSPISAGNATSQMKSSQVSADATIGSKALGIAGSVIGAIIGALVMAAL